MNLVRVPITYKNKIAIINMWSNEANTKKHLGWFPLKGAHYHMIKSAALKPQSNTGRWIGKMPKNCPVKIGNYAVVKKAVAFPISWLFGEMASFDMPLRVFHKSVYRIFIWI